VIKELKTQLALTSKDNLVLRKKLQSKKHGSERPKTTSMKLEPVSSTWISPIDESITPIRHVIMSRKGDIISQD